MVSMRSIPRVCIGALVALSLSSPAFAEKEKGKKDAKEEKEGEKKGGMMEEGGKDPAETEGFEEGAFVPGKKKKAAAAECEEGEECEESEEAEEGDGEKKEEAPKKDKPRKVRKTIGVFAEALFGLGEAPKPGAGDVTTKDDVGNATSIGLLVGGHYDLTPELRAMLRVPWTTVSADKSVAALGAPELAGRLRLTPPGDTEWAIKLAIGVPIAQGNPDPTNPGDAAGQDAQVAQRLADAANGWHDPELYAAKRLPITPSLLLTYRADRLRIGGELKAPLMPKISGGTNDPGFEPGGTHEMSSFAFSLLVGGTASYEVIDKGHLALSAWVTYPLSEQATYSSSAAQESPLLFVLEPKILAQIGRVVPSLGAVLPVAGPLAGKIVGFRLHVDVIF